MRNIIPSQQFGFRRAHNTVHPLIRIKKMITGNFRLQKTTGMVLLDVKGAFDTVWHEGSIYKIIMYDFPIYLIKIIQNFISQRLFRVHIGSFSSHPFSFQLVAPRALVCRN